jgi:hypothetical protein
MSDVKYNGGKRVMYWYYIYDTIYVWNVLVHTSQ